MSSHVGLFFDAGGNLIKIVRPHFDEPGRVLTEKDFAGHVDKGQALVMVAAADYAGKAPINIDGAAVYQDLQKLALPILQADPAAAGIAKSLAAKIAAVDAQSTQAAAAVADIP